MSCTGTPFPWTAPSICTPNTKPAGARTAGGHGPRTGGRPARQDAALRTEGVEGRTEPGCPRLEEGDGQDRAARELDRHRLRGRGRSETGQDGVGDLRLPSAVELRRRRRRGVRGRGD